MKRKLFALSILSLGLTMTAFASIQRAATCCQQKAACCDKAATCCDQGKCCDKAACCKKSPKPTCCNGKEDSRAASGPRQ